MARTKTLHTSFDLFYSSRTENHETVRDIRINFENPDEDTLAENLNTWLAAIGVALRVGSE